MRFETIPGDAAPPSNPKRPGRPRSETAQAAILDAAIELMLDRGVESVSIEEVAAKAGSSKATIYRWWPSKEHLALDALDRALSSARRPPAAETGSLRESVLAVFLALVRQFEERPFGRVFAGVMAHAQTNPEYAKLYVDRFVAPRRLDMHPTFDAAVERGELPAGTDYDFALELIFSPFWTRLLHGYGPYDDAWVERIVDAALAGLRAGPYAAP